MKKSMKRKSKYIILTISAVLILFFCLMYFVLKNTSEINIHQMRGAIGNVVYISNDGHKEAVYDSAKNIVTDPVNKGSYNYSNPIKDPYGHFFKDIFPWLILGNTRDDPTTISERLSAYNKDLKIGFKRTFGIKETTNQTQDTSMKTPVD